jgi:HSP20 family protein
MRSLIPWRRKTGEPLSPFRNEVRDFFERFFAAPFELNANESVAVWAPRVDVSETNEEIQVKADLPGVDPKDLNISVNEGCLILRGEKKEEHEEKKKDYHSVERFEGRFYREIPLPAGTDNEKITATSSKGVVSINIPKTAKAQAKKIAVKAHD